MQRTILTTDTDNTSRMELERTAKERRLNLFNQLCDAARKLDALGIYKILTTENLKINEVKIDQPGYDAKSVIMQMAEENNLKAVEILINECQANPADAVEGFARAKQSKTVARYLEDYAAGDRAVRGYAFAGALKELNTMLNYGASLTAAAYGAARAGNLALVFDLIEREQADITTSKVALIGFIHSGLHDHAEHLILRATQFLREHSPAGNEFLRSLGTKTKASKDEDILGQLCDTAIGAFAETGELNYQSNLLKLLSTTKDEGIVKHFEAFLNQNRKVIENLMDNMNMTEIIQKATAIRHALHKTADLSYDQALVNGVGDIKPEPKQGFFAKLKRQPKTSTQPVTPQTEATIATTDATKLESTPPSPKLK